MAHTTVIADGSFDFAGGVNSDAVTTVRSSLVPHGLRRDQLAWISNGNVRGGTIAPRPGFLKTLDLLNAGLWQGGIFFEPITDDPPYLLCSISGRIYTAQLIAPYQVVDLSAKFGLANPPAVAQAFFCQGNGIAVIQAGDGVTPPLFYSTAEGEKLVRSRGLNGVLSGPTCQQLPPAFAMVFYQGRMWYANGRKYTAGDIEGNANSGTLPWQFKDSILSVTENPLALAGDGFIVPSSAGLIRALAYTANLDTTLGQGQLYIFTRKQIYSLAVPVSRADWIGATSNNQPLQTVAQINNGAVGEDGIVHVNGDLFYQGIEPSIRSFTVASRYYGQWGNVPISNNVNRALQFNDRSVLRRASGAFFDNRMIEGCLPKQTVSGVVTPGLLPLDFDTISTLEEREPPAWEGMWEGLDVLKMFTGDFGGLQRAFAVCVSRLDNSLDIYEMSQASTVDNNGADTDIRIGWAVEFPAFTWGKEFELKELMGGELWVDRVKGTVEVHVLYRPDADACWHEWFPTSFCAVRNCAEDVNTPVCYPIGPNYRDGYRFPVGFPTPPPDANAFTRRPTNLGFQFQVRIEIKGYCRIRGLILYAQLRDMALYENVVFPTGQALATPIGTDLQFPAALPALPVVPLPPVTPPVKHGYAIQNWPAVLAQLTGTGTCANSASPAWGGLFDLLTAWTGGPLWYFVNQSINGKSVSADQAPDYPNGDWQNNDNTTQIFFDTGQWFLWLVCNGGATIWQGTGTSADPTNPTGVYTRIAGTSALPATITLASQ